MRVTVIGIDCATDPPKVGLALGSWCEGDAEVQRVALGSRGQPLAAMVADWIAGNTPTLIAIDAPLGWPAKLGDELSDHSAGEPIDSDPNRLFRRETDRVVRERLGRQPLDVGADLIARTAYAALQLLGELRQVTGYTIPLAWHSEVEGVSAIEVYLAATLTAYGILSSGYKRKHQAEERVGIIEGLRSHLKLPNDVSLMQSNADALDAAICVLAGADFLDGRAEEPRDTVAAHKEGWIWFYSGQGMLRAQTDRDRIAMP